MDRYKYNNNLSNKLNLVLFTSINSNIKIKNDPIPYLLTNYSEIEAFFELKNKTKILYFNMKSIHPILYEYDKVIKIKESEDNQSSNFYLLLLIKSESDLINYEYSIKYILRSDVKRIIVLDDSSIEDKSISLDSEANEGNIVFNDSLWI